MNIRYISIPEQTAEKYVDLVKTHRGIKYKYVQTENYTKTDNQTYIVFKVVELKEPWYKRILSCLNKNGNL